MPDPFPRRIVCLTEESTETLYLLGEEDRIVGISGFTVRPPRARKEKPRVSAFTSAKLDAIVDLRPDLVVGFSDIQADIAAELIRRGVEVWISNHRSVEGILAYIQRLGSFVGAGDRAAKLCAEASAHLDEVAERAAALPRRPRIYFEEWDDPLISGSQWVSELMTIAGGDDIFPECATSSLAKGRIIADRLEPARRRPDIVIGSWCGKKFRPAQVAARDGWQDVPAVRDGELHEVKSAVILQPGPAALFDGIDAMAAITAAWGSGR